MDMIIKNGTVVTDSEMFRADVAVKDGKIVSIAESINTGGCNNVVDAEGKLVLPGAIDAHTHLALPEQGPLPAAVLQRYLILYCRISANQWLTPLNAVTLSVPETLLWIILFM